MACGAQTRLLLPRSRYGEWVDALGAFVGAMATGDPMDSGTMVGPSVFYKVVYAGSGEYDADASTSCGSETATCWDGDAHETFTFTNWSATYPAVELSATGGRGSAPTGASLTRETTEAWRPRRPRSFPRPRDLTSFPIPCAGGSSRTSRLPGPS